MSGYGAAFDWARRQIDPSASRPRVLGTRHRSRIARITTNRS